MKQIATFEIGTGHYTVPADGEFLNALWEGDTLVAYYLVPSLNYETTQRDFHLVDATAQHTLIPDGYTYLCAVPRGQHDTTNCLLFIR